MTAVALVDRALPGYPINDDWVYGKCVFTLMQTGQFDFPTFAGMSLFTHVLWGGLFCVLFGSNFTSLHIAGLVMSLLGAILLYRFVLQQSSSPSVASLFTVSLCLNPIFFALSCSFMTDVPFLVLALVTVISYVQLAKEPKLTHAAAFSLSSIVSTMIRQCGLCFTGAAMGTEFLLRGRGKSVLLPVCSAFVLSCLVLLTYEHWLQEHSRNLDEYLSLTSLLQGQISSKRGHLPLINSLARLTKMPFYYGFLLGPIGLGIFAGYWRESRRKFLAITVGALIMSVAMIWKFHAMPLCANVLEKTGIGPLTIAINLPTLNASVANLLTCLCALAALSILAEVLRCGVNWKSLSHSEQKVFCFALLASLLYGAPLLVPNPFFDRYMIPLMPPCLLVLLLSKSYRRMHFIVAWAAASVMVTATAILLFNYHSLQQARWQLIDAAANMGIDRSRINAGFESSGLYIYKWPMPTTGTQWRYWCLNPDAYVCGEDHSMPGYHQVRRLDFAQLLSAPPGRLQLVVRDKQP